MNFETKAIHTGIVDSDAFGSTAVPIYQGASFSYDKAEDLESVFAGRSFGHVYSRISNPTVTALELRLTALEKGLGSVAVASGMSAIAGVLFALTQPGDHVLFSKSLFGGTYYILNELMAQYQVEVSFFDSQKIDDLDSKITKKTAFIFAETIGNPKLDVPDMRKLSDRAKQNNIPLVIDATATTSYLFDAKKWGADIVLHSLTKYMAGSGTIIGGVVVDCGTYNWRKSRVKWIVGLAKDFGPFAFLSQLRKHIVINVGSCLSPMNAFQTLVGLETLGLRMDRHCDNALALAHFLTKHPKVKEVHYLGLKTALSHAIATQQFNGKYGGLLTLRCGSKEEAFKMLNTCKLVKNMTNLGDSKTLAIHPASTIYRQCSSKEKEQAGVTEDLVRVSVGLEHIDDIITDFDQALNREEDK